MEQANVDIIEFKDQYALDFATLNFEWLEKYFHIEDYDKKILTNPQKYILDPGGQILFAIVDDKIVGTVALIKRGEGVFELAKMAVTEGYKGLKIGQKLMYACIDYAGQHGVKQLFLDSNTKLAPAISLYNKVGFKEIPVPGDSLIKDVISEWSLIYNSDRGNCIYRVNDQPCFYEYEEYDLFEGFSCFIKFTVWHIWYLH
ncbi:GNAT family N-acetyltransferase [Sphingobacteriaceae bacterium AH-315-L07]|nr:GNAT family N-acetyltransferase [Sphingobacteriaceae bacterium AH-315-L07]